MPWRMRSIMVSGGMLVRICMIMRLTQNACLVTHRIGVVFTSSMGWYTEEQRVIVRAYWKTESIKSPSHNIYSAARDPENIWKFFHSVLVEEIGNNGNIIGYQEGVQNCQKLKDRLLTFPKKSLRRLLEEIQFPHANINE